MGHKRTLNYKVIGSVIKKYREKANLNQEELSSMAGISQNYLAKIEIGQKHPTLDTLVYICNALGITVNDLLMEDDMVAASGINEKTLRMLENCSDDGQLFIQQLLDFLITFNETHDISF